MAKITAVVSGKGGVGKSTVSAGLGAALASRGERVLLLDCDAGLRCLDALLGVTEQLVFDASDVINGTCTPQQAVYPCASCPGLSMVAAPLEAELQPAAVRMLTERYRNSFDWIILDAPAGIEAGFSAAVAPASSAWVVVTPDPVSVRSGGIVRQALAKQGISDCRLLINRFSADRFVRIGSFEDMDELIDRTGVQLLGVIPEDSAIPMMAARGVPILTRGACSQAFRRVASRLCGERIPLPPPERI